MFASLSSQTEHHFRAQCQKIFPCMSCERNFFQANLEQFVHRRRPVQSFRSTDSQWRHCIALKRTVVSSQHCVALRISQDLTRFAFLLYLRSGWVREARLIPEKINAAQSIFFFVCLALTLRPFEPHYGHETTRDDISREPNAPHIASPISQNFEGERCLLLCMPKHEHFPDVARHATVGTKHLHAHKAT